MSVVSYNLGHLSVVSLLACQLDVIWFICGALLCLAWGRIKNRAEVIRGMGVQNDEKSRTTSNFS